jgi:Polyphosphate kinase 2 (PPK2)
MPGATDSKYAPWQLVRSDDKRRARLNCISNLLSLIPYKVPCEKVKLPKRSEKQGHDDQKPLEGHRFIRKDINVGVSSRDEGLSQKGIVRSNK